MIIDNNYLVIESTGSGGDSAHYSGLLTIAADNYYGLDLAALVLPDGYAVRHPGDGLVEWHSNPGNTSRDQIMPLVVGLSVQGRTDLARAIAKQHAKRFFFAQNIDRDWPNTPKKPYPHFYTDLSGEKQFSWFNYRDPLLPHHIQAMLLSADYKLAYLMYPISLITFIIEGLSIRYSSNDDVGTYFATGYALGLTKLFKKLIPDWKGRMDKYFLGWRKGELIHEPLVRKINNL